jgi:hypothetical protein
MASSLPCISLNEGENKVSVRLNTDCLAPGYYVLKLVAYEVGSLGASRNMDVIDEACAFEKAQSGENNQMAWNTKWWGHLMLPELTVIGDET